MLMPTAGKCRSRRKEQGVVLFLALIILVAMMLGGVALFRTMDVGILTVGNISMQKNATRSGDAAVEAAITWLDGAGVVLNADDPGNGYMAAGLSAGAIKASNQTWQAYWDQLASVYTPKSLPEDAAGNTPAYLIQRLCDLPGQPYSGGNRCVKPPAGSSTGSSMGAGFISMNRASGTYYRILVRTTGPRGVVSFLQAIMYM